MNLRAPATSARCAFDADALRKAVQMITSQDPVNTCYRHLDLMVAGQVPNDPLRTEMIGFAQIQNLVLDLLGRFIGMIVRP